MEVPKQRARCGPHHCVLGLTDTDTYSQRGNYQHGLRVAVAYESYRTRCKTVRVWTQTEWPDGQKESPSDADSSYSLEEAWCASCHSSSSCDLWWGACCAHPELRCEVRAHSRRQERRCLQGRTTGKTTETTAFEEIQTNQFLSYSFDVSLVQQAQRPR